jgi:hypothetical protein
MSTTKVGPLEMQIEELVRGHIAALRARAAAAVERAFGVASPSKPRRCGTSSPTVRPSAARRPPQEMAAVAERLYAAICAHPGAAMTTLADEVGATARELNRPALALKRAGRVRSVGQRQGMRYFPTSAKASAART